MGAGQSCTRSPITQSLKVGGPSRLAKADTVGGLSVSSPAKQAVMGTEGLLFLKCFFSLGKLVFVQGERALALKCIPFCVLPRIPSPLNPYVCCVCRASQGLRRDR